MDKNILGTDRVIQIGIIVSDIEKTAGAYADFLGIDQPEIILSDAEEKACTQYRGESSKARIKMAFFNVGSIMLELIEPDNEPSTWREFLDTNGEGVHHIAFGVKGMKEKVALLGKNDMPLIQKGEYEGGRYAYIDSLKDLKVIIELLEND